jgi:prevent-host-death family protein
MTQTMTAREARDNFSDLLGSVYFGKQTVTITKKGKPYAIAVNPGLFKAMQANARKKAVNLLDNLGNNNQSVPLEIVVKDSIAAVDEVRVDIYDRYQHASKTKKA